jgi:hypothetical protein
MEDGDFNADNKLLVDLEDSSIPGSNHQQQHSNGHDSGRQCCSSGCHQRVKTQQSTNVTSWTSSILLEKCHGKRLMNDNNLQAKIYQQK